MRTATGEESVGLLEHDILPEGDIRVLHVDDDELFLDLVEAQLAERTLEIRTETSAEDALARLDTVDCVVSDYEMPGLDGLELLDSVREEYPELPFILFTGKGSEEIASEAISAGVTDYLQKEGGSSQYEVLYNRIVNAVRQYRAEQAFKYSRKRYRSLVEESPNAICLLQDGQIVYANDTFLDLVDVPDREAVYGTEYLEFVHPDHHEQARERVRRITEEGVPVDRRVGRLVTAADEIREVEAVATPLSYNSTIGIQIVLSDITEQQEREQELRRTRERFRKVFEASHDAIMVVDIDSGSFREANPAACEMLGYDRAELLELDPADIHPTDIDRVREEFLDQIREDGAGWTDELACLTKEGEVVPTEISGAILDLAEDGEQPTTMVAVLRDVSERVAYREDLEQQLERADAFADVLGHDLRNPLNVATAHLEMAREEFDSDHLDGIANGLDRMETLIDDLLLLARGRQRIGETEPVDLESVVGRCWGNVETQGAELRVDGGLTAEADPSRLGQLLENLFRNAVEHGSRPPGAHASGEAPDGDTGTVTITVAPLEDGFAVEDDGPGISPEERSDVFDPGYSTTEGGTGLGLAIVERIADAHGWQIAVTESSEGGARFEITGVDVVSG